MAFLPVGDTKLLKIITFDVSTTHTMQRTTLTNCKKKLIFIFLCYLIQNTNFAQTQKGIDIDGKAVSDLSGGSVSMPDSNTVAIGASGNDEKAKDAGHVRIYTWSGSAWVQKGIDIYGEALSDGSGGSVSMSDANTVAIGAGGNNGRATDAGHVRIYTWSGSAWEKKGADIDGEAGNDASGCSVSMPDAYTVAIGAFANDGTATDAGHVRVYFSWNDWSGYSQKGADIDGEAGGDQSGFSVSMPDANTVAIGAFANDGTAKDAGHVRVYSWSGSAWVQKGADIDGEAGSDNSGYSVSMPDSNTVAIGAPYNDGTAADAGHVRIYSWSGSAWVQKGADIDGEASSDNSGWSVCMPNANTVAIGASSNTGTAAYAGHVRIYSWSGSAWVKKGSDIDGEASVDQSGWSVCMPDANTVAIGAPANDRMGDFSGHVRVYTLNNNLTIEENVFGLALNAFPNPTLGELNVELGSIYQNVTVIIKNNLGQKLFEKPFDKVHLLNLNIAENAGIYLIEIQTESKSAILKVIKT